MIGEQHDGEDEGADERELKQAQAEVPGPGHAAGEVEAVAEGYVGVRVHTAVPVHARRSAAWTAIRFATRQQQSRFVHATIRFGAGTVPRPREGSRQVPRQAYLFY